jgi:prophage DNA circulation protein
MNILDLDNAWRHSLLPASYKGAEFHVEAMTAEGGRRLVMHEFPKKERPYAEDMGRRASGFTVRGYLINFMSDTELPLYQKNFLPARDRLRAALDEGGAGRLQLPSLPAVMVACDRYRLLEETRLGGYCTFDMTFVEQGEAPAALPPSTRDLLIDQSQAMVSQVLTNLGGSTPFILGDVGGALQAQLASGR